MSTSGWAYFNVSPSVSDPPLLRNHPECRPLLPEICQLVDQWLRKSGRVWTIACASLSVSHTVSASTSECYSTSLLTTTCESTSVSTSACVSRPACRPGAAHRSLCRLAPLLHLCLRLSQRVDHCLRKSASVSLSGCASLTVSPSATAANYDSDSASVSTTACASRPACPPVAVLCSVCRLAFLNKPQLETQEACRPVLAEVGHIVDQLLRICHCVS